jgi:hypothetical protein
MLYLLILNVVIIQYYDTPGDSRHTKPLLDPGQSVVVNEVSLGISNMHSVDCSLLCV